MLATNTLDILIPEIRLFHNKERFVRFIKKKLGRDIEPLSTGGQMYYSSGVAVILLEYIGDANTERALLVHEAYHAVLAHMGYLGEDSAGEEVMAYYMQTISHALFSAHDKWKSKREH